MRLKKDKSGDTVGRPSWRSSLPGAPGANFFCGKRQHMKNSLNFANTCLKIVDTGRPERGPLRGKRGGWEGDSLRQVSERRAEGWSIPRPLWDAQGAQNRFQTIS